MTAVVTLAKKMCIASTVQAGREVEEKVLGEAARFGFNEVAAFAIKLALEEGINNAARHGNGYDPGKTIEVT